MRVAHNITALTAWRNLNQVSGQLGKSVERLSSGYRINKAADDPAGLVLSENLRAQIVGMDQALSNTQDAISMIQTAEGALTEIHSLLDSMRSLALHAANTATITSEAIAADQQQMDSAIESIDRIATTTAFAGKKLLDGSVGKSIEIKNSGVVTSASVGKASVPGISYVTVHVTSAATRATLGKDEGEKVSGGDKTLSGAGVLSSAGETTTLNINGVQVTLNGEMTFSEAMETINDALSSAGLEIHAKFITVTGGVYDTISGANNSGYIALVHENYGSDYLIDLYDEKGLIISVTSGSYTKHARGTDISGYFKYKRVDTSGTTYTHVNAVGDGLTLKGASDTVLEDMAITLNSGSNTSDKDYVDVVRLYGSTAQFQIGANAGEIYAFSINSMRASELGADYTTQQGAEQRGLLALKTGGDYALANNPQEAIKVIDEAISDISAERAKLGAIQTNVLESNQRSLNVTRENLQASESRIRDVDMAKEMMEFTRNNVLTQAAMAMLAQANTLPNMVLTLLR
ncbi:hypothetical protein DRJ00_09040 [Candidatus Aerophobetes bacterium]|uniref:Flagellin n=1 Tax=Aerophobetes bacterium TaxID=2030807 RepID=A0A497E353_UNCAE|nr:MAG: hypothetical protein DRJ00_09040 [Candidatus Aerophobetes bacterium]